MSEEFVPNDRAIWQSERAKTYRCLLCGRPVFSGYEGDETPAIFCDQRGHHLVWESQDAKATSVEQPR